MHSYKGTGAGLCLSGLTTSAGGLSALLSSRNDLLVGAVGEVARVGVVGHDDDDGGGLVGCVCEGFE